MNRIELKGATGAETVLLVDGYRMNATGAHLALDAGEVPSLIVRLPLTDEVSIEHEEVRVLTDQPTHAALVAMGWTPPEGV